MPFMTNGKRDPQKAKESLYKWRQENPEKAKAIARRAYQKNKAKYLAKAAERDERMRLCSLKDELTKFVHEEAYSLCLLRNQVTGIKWHVDHKIPLKHKNISGLHVWSNLQVIPALENLRKGNRYAFYD